MQTPSIHHSSGLSGSMGGNWTSPTREELWKILQSLSRRKALGLDGITAEVLLASWSFLRVDYHAMVKHLWETRVLPHNTIVGMINLIPKKVDKRRLQGWRPLTMLLVVYNPIAKLLLVRFSPHNQHLINPWQTGFILGRFILENISCLDDLWLDH